MNSKACAHYQNQSTFIAYHTKAKIKKPTPSDVVFIMASFQHDSNKTEIYVAKNVMLKRKS